MSSLVRASILLADDHTIFREGLASLLQDTYDLVGTAADGQALFELARSLQPDVVVTDISMPRMDGLEAVRKLRAVGVQAKIIVLTMHAEGNIAAEAFRAGVQGYLLKQAAVKELLVALEEVLGGRVYLTPLIAKDLIALLLDDQPASSRAAPEQGKEVRLSPRQRQVLRLVAEGRTMKEVGNLLRISSRTAEAHKYEMMQVLGTQTTAELVQFAIRFGLVSVA